VEIDDTTFEEFINSKDVAVIDFYANWCMPCRMIEPLIKSLASEYDGSVGFARLNVDSSPMIASALEIRSIPTLVFTKNGKYADRMIGVRPKGHIARMIESIKG